MSVSIALQNLRGARQEFERCREKQAAEEKKSAKLDEEAGRKERSAEQTRSPSSRATYLREATRKRNDAATARTKAAGHSGDAAKAQTKVHAAEVKLRDAEALETKRAAERQRTAEKRAATDRARADTQREAGHRREVSKLQHQIDAQAELLAAKPWDRAPESITVLFIAASPEDQLHIRIDQEMREVQQAVRAADFRESLRFDYAVAAQPADLLQRLNEAKPDIVHFAGHSGEAGLALEDADGLTTVLGTDDLATLLRVSSRRIRLVVFNSCDSADHAAAAAQHLDAAIGMEQPIGDAAAKTFASQLYSSIAFGLPLQQAFDQALLQVRLRLGDQSGEPKLHTAAGLDANQVYLVRPRGTPTE